MSRIERIIAARKGVKTRRANRAQMDFINKIIIPEKRRLNSLQTVMLRQLKLKGVEIKLRWNPLQETPRKLKNNVEYGTLVGFRDGNFLLVLPDGYKCPQIYSARSWEVLVP